MYNIGTQTIYSVQFIVEGVIFKHIVVKKTYRQHYGKIT